MDASDTIVPAEKAPAATVGIGRYRWRICALLFAATTLNYIDRQVIGILAPDLQRLFSMSEIEYSYIIIAFQVAYAIGLLGAGAIIDKWARASAMRSPSACGASQR